MTKETTSAQMSHAQFRTWLEFFRGATVRKSKCGKTDWTIAAGWYEHAGIHSRGRVLLTRKGPDGGRIKYTTDPHQIRLIQD